MCEIHLPKIEIQCSYVKSTTERNIVNYANGRYKTRRSQHSQECKPHTGIVLCLVTLTVDLLTPKINHGFPGLMVEHLCIRFGDATVCEISCG